MRGIGLVLSGGGGKGSYQIGVWKYLHELGLDQYIRAVSGTSVGALNASLFAVGSLEKAEDVWRNISPSQILTPQKISAKEVAIWLAQHQLSTAFHAMAGVASSVFSSALSATLKRRAAFSREGLLEIMNHRLDFCAIQNSEIPCYATCLRVANLRPQRFDLRKYEKEEIKNILLASSAIPIVFDAVDIDGQSYYDGGIPFIGDNVPIDPIYHLGFENIIVVHLSTDTVIDHAKYPNSRIIEIVPGTDLGGPISGTLDFTAQGSAWRIEQG